MIDVPSGKTRRTVEKFPNRFLAFQADGKSVAGCSRGGRLKLALCSLATGEVKSVLDQEVPLEKTVEQIAFSLDGSKLATSERNFVNGTLQYDAYTIRLWDALTGKQLAEFEGRRSKPGTKVAQARQGKTPPAAMGFGGVQGLAGNQPIGGFGPAAQGEYEASSACCAAVAVFSHRHTVAQCGHKHGANDRLHARPLEPRRGCLAGQPAGRRLVCGGEARVRRTAR